MKGKLRARLMPSLQKLGRSLIVPIATLPAAAILFRLGSEDLLNIPILHLAGQTVFSNLPILFAIGVAIGFANEAGVAALSAAIGYLILVNVSHVFNEAIDVGVFGGIIVGLITAYLYNRYHNIKVPEVLAFFGGKRFVPIAASLAGIVLGIFFGFAWPPIQNALEGFGSWLNNTGPAGPSLYFMFNRALLPFGLHHIPNNYVYFLMGSYESGGQLFTGEIPRYLQGDPTAGRFMAGFFPVMMLGYPGAALAMIHTAHKSQRNAVRGIMISAAFASFLTGITEPIEFAYTFVAPLLFVVNIGLSGIAALVTDLLGIRAGFGFSAGFIDYVLGYGLAEKPILLLGISVLWGILFYVIFRYLIVKFNLPTLGREVDEEADESKENKISTDL